MKKLLAILLAAVFSISCIGCGGGQTGDADADTGVVTEAPVALEDEFRYMMHAGGITPNGAVGTNSLEALNFSYKNGYRTIEVDIGWSADNQLVCFQSGMALSELVNWMNERKDVVIVTDFTDRGLEAATVLSKAYPDMLDRFYVQIYSTEDYDQVYLLGFKNIVLTVYKMSWAEKTDTAGLVEFARTHKLAGLAYPIDLHNWSAEYTTALLAADTPLYIHTVNDVKVQEELFAAGVFGVVTDTGKS